MDIFKDRLKECRIERNVSIKDICEHLGIGDRAYRYYESGERYPDIHKLIALADYLDVSIDYLVGRTDAR